MKTLEKDQKMYDKLMRDVRPVLERRFGRSGAEELLRKTEPIYQRFLSETPYIGGRENVMGKSLDMAMPFFALYEASGRSLTEADVDEMLDIVMVGQYRKLGKIFDMNRLDRPWLTKLLHAWMERLAKKINANKGKDWNNTWGVQINPEGHSHGLAVTLVGCPLADFARAHGYMEMMPWMCRADERAAQALHARLIRHHTVAQGADTCDYWFVGDRDTQDR